MSSPETFPPELIQAAALNPGGKVYVICGNLDPNGAIPPQAISGSWTVGADGKLTGEFVSNPDYDPERFPDGG